MTDIEKALGSRPERTRGQLPKGWLILTGVLVLLNLITLGVGKYREGRLSKELDDANKQHALAVQQLQQQQSAQLETTIRKKGESIARTLQMVNPLLLTDQGQKLALDYFTNLLEDPNIEFIALYDANGTICATSNLRLDKVVVPPGLGSDVSSQKGQFGADIQFFGPITNSSGRQVGAALIGMTFNTGETTTPAARPSAEASENFLPATPPEPETAETPGGEQVPSTGQ
jgi:hypothetical protein